jgi:beta-1,4-mannosyl-glycoprotein beta-1,4-N-acetylglucosaminyltransferase
MIVDTFMFFNEFDILEGRLEYLYDHVDYFVLVECNITQSGDPKPMLFMNNMSRYKKYLDKVLYFPFITKRSDFNYSQLPTHDRDYNTGPWQQENAQRNYISKSLELFEDDAIIMLSDLDEIPNKECITIAKDCFSRGWDRLGIQQDHFAYNFKQKQSIPTIGTTITTNKVAKEVTPQGLRNERYGYGIIYNGGWHLTYWGDVETIRYKIQTFAHQELNQECFKTQEHIKERILTGQDMFNRGNPYVPTQPGEIPQDIMDIFGKVQDKISQSIK